MAVRFVSTLLLLPRAPAVPPDRLVGRTPAKPVLVPDAFPGVSQATAAFPGGRELEKEPHPTAGAFSREIRQSPPCASDLPLSRAASTRAEPKARSLHVLTGALLQVSKSSMGQQESIEIALTHRQQISRLLQADPDRIDPAATEMPSAVRSMPALQLLQRKAQLHFATSPPVTGNTSDTSSPQYTSRSRSSSQPHGQVPTVRHNKQPGGGYGPLSPLRVRQEAWEDMLRSNPQFGDRPIPGVADYPIPGVGNATAKDKEPPAAQSPLSSVTTTMSTTMDCIINLAVQFVLVCIVKYVVRSSQPPSTQQRMDSAVETVSCIPMLCVLFLGTRLRAVQLAKGMPEIFDLPPWWVKASMSVCTWSMLWWTITASLWSLIDGLKEGIPGKITLALRNFFMLCVYVSLAVVCFGMCVMEPPPELWGQAGGPSVSPAVICMMCLTVVYFAVFLALECAKVTSELGLLGQARRFSHGQELLKNAATTVSFAPMLCVLFIAARLRALQFDLAMGSPQRWVQVFVTVCTLSIFAQTLLAAARATIEWRRDKREGQGVVAFRRQSDTTTWLFDLIKLILLAWNYICVAAIIVGMVLMQPPDDYAGPPGFPPSLFCTVLLTVLYFAIYLAGWVVQLTQRPSAPASSDHGGSLVVRLGVYLEHRAKDAVAFGPIFCIIFMGTLLRALQVTKGRGSPQAWCHQVEYIATAAIACLVFTRFDSLMLSPPQSVTMFCAIVQYFWLVVLCCSMVALVVAMATMTEANTTGKSGVLSA